MTAITSRPRALSPSTAFREERSDIEHSLARRRRRVYRGVVASYLHDISARHTPAAAAT
jgi:hypothetical protein